jgi:thiol-disulfide isomerase/thioredoxin
MPRPGAALLAAMTAGLAALLAAIAVALIAGGVWRMTSGRMRTPRGARASSPAVAEQRAGAAVPAAGSAPAAAGSAPAVTGGPVMTLEEADPAMPPDAADAGLTLTSDDLGHPLGGRATLVQFSSAFCAPCRATRRILAEVAQMAEGVAHVEIDAESHLDLVRSLGVMRTPTVLVTDAEGRIVKRASGQPRKPEVIAALGEAVR